MAIHLQLLQESLQALTPVAAEVIDHFYKTLLEDHPRTAAQWPNGFSETDKDAIIQAVIQTFAQLGNEAALRAKLENLSGRCALAAKDAPDLIDSILSTFQYFFDATWSPELESSWKELLNFAMGALTRRSSSVSDDKIKAEIEQTLRGLIRESLAGLVNESQMREYAAEQAKALIKEAMQAKLDSLRNRFKGPKAA